MPTPSPADAGDAPARSARLRSVFADAWRREDGALGCLAGQDMLALFFDLADWKPWLDDARLLLDEPELERVRRKQRTRDREDLALGYALHRLVLGCALGRDPERVALDRDPLGRPCLRDDALQTSLSHASAAVAIAVSRHGCVGIDLESTVRAVEMPEIAERVAHPTEAGELALLPETERAAALLRLWVRKEALLKAAGIGLAREMDSFRGPAGEALALPAADGPDGTEAIIHMLEIGPDWVAAIAGPPPAATRSFWLRPCAD